MRSALARGLERSEGGGVGLLGEFALDLRLREGGEHAGHRAAIPRRGGGAVDRGAGAGGLLLDHDIGVAPGDGVRSRVGIERPQVQPSIRFLPQLAAEQVRATMSLSEAMEVGAAPKAPGRPAASMIGISCPRTAKRRR